MAEEDFGTHTEIDPNSRITKTTRRITFTALTNNEDAYVYLDKGTNFFDGDFAGEFIFFISVITVNQPVIAPLALTNSVDDLTGIDTANGSYLALYILYATGDIPRIGLKEVDSGTAYFDVTAIDFVLSTIYYGRTWRDEGVGTYGTMYLAIYSDAARSVQVGSTDSLALHTSKKDFQYIFGINTYNTTSSDTITGYIENLELFDSIDSVILPTVTAQPATDITSTTATGHGTIVGLGISAVSAHGYVWDSTVDPTTADSSSGFWGSTDSGAGSLGVFESSITGLLAGQEYYARPYATNGAGTIYGANVYFIAGQPGTLRIKAEYAVVQTQWHYVDEDGKERYLTGTLA